MDLIIGICTPFSAISPFIIILTAMAAGNATVRAIEVLSFVAKSRSLDFITSFCPLAFSIKNECCIITISRAPSGSIIFLSIKSAVISKVEPSDKLTFSLLK